MEAFLNSILLVALAEIGDKTQLLSFVLAARLRKPWVIIAGIFIATIFNHTLAGAIGVWLANQVNPETLRWIVGTVFIGFGFWILVPDKLEGEPKVLHASVLITTIVVFFLAEMGDKTQFATIALAARYDNLAAVVAGTTIGMMAANIPAVLIGEKLSARIPLRLVRGFAAALFFLTGVVTLY